MSNYHRGGNQARLVSGDSPYDLAQQMIAESGSITLRSDYGHTCPLDCNCKRTLRHLTRDEAIARNWSVVHTLYYLCDNGRYRNVRFNGQTKTWKRDPERLEIPVKYGMYECFRITERDLDRLLVEA